MVPELHYMRIVGFFEAVTPGWVTIAVRLTLAIDYVRYRSSFEGYKRRSKASSLPGPRTINKPAQWAV